MAKTKELSSSIQEKLMQAEEAERTVQKLQAVAAEVPQLRAELAKLQQREARERAREKAMVDAQKAVTLAAAKQAQVAALLEAASKKVQDLYTVMRDMDSYYHDAMQALAAADRVDYEIDLEETGEEQRSLGRDTRGLDYILAARHGEKRAKQMLVEMGVELDYFRDCDLEDPLRQGLAHLILEQAVSKRMDGTAKSARNESPVSQSATS